MNTAGFTAYVDLEEALAQIDASDEFSDAVLAIMDEAAVQLDFSYTGYNHKEPIEIGWITNEETAAMIVISELVRKLPVQFIMKNTELHKLMKEIETVITINMEGIYVEKAVEIAFDAKQEYEAQKADYLYDEMRERRRYEK